ncbi:MAG: hypothetical protein NPIRA02_30870 [Nitrospirales bacterium]|nr:MAG: hypothetical protein NPIRA02_30870 [Nitrospirales bacterium]
MLIEKGSDNVGPFIVERYISPFDVLISYTVIVIGPLREKKNAETNFWQCAHRSDTHIHNCDRQ